MSAATLFTWTITAIVGLVLLIVWLMEYDRDFQSVAATRLPVPVISAHALLGISGLLVWGFYLVTGTDQLAWATVADIGLAAVLGLVMAARWIGVYRGYAAPALGGTPGMVAVPPERHFPLPVVLVHGLFAVATLVMVVWVAFFSGR